MHFTFVEVGLEVLNNIQILYNCINRWIGYLINDPAYKVAAILGFFLQQNLFLSG